MKTTTSPRRPADGLEDVPFVAFDTETTGLAESDRLVELAAVRFRGGEVEGEWCALVDPQQPIPAEATAIHGIRDEDVRGQPLAARVLPAFLDFIEGAALVGHNAPFDVRVLALELLRAGLPLPDNPVVDTCSIPRRLHVRVPNHRLSTLADTFHVPQGRAHRALADARVAMDLLRAYLRDLGPAADTEVRKGLTATEGLVSFRAWATRPLPATPLVALVRRARAEGREIEAFLHGQKGSRRLAPQALYAVHDSVYLEARCLEDGLLRTFPLDQVERAHLAWARPG